LGHRGGSGVKYNFYESREWRELRYKALKEQGHKCKSCGATAENAVLHVDHIKPRSKYPELELDPSNVQVLCEDCNMGKSDQHEDRFVGETLEEKESRVKRQSILKRINEMDELATVLGLSEAETQNARRSAERELRLVTAQGRARKLLAAGVDTFAERSLKLIVNYPLITNRGDGEGA
jgi:uncharacterized protein (TIGR02646 family)